MAALDRRMRADLVAGGSLFDGYRPRMAVAHLRNASLSSESLDEHGRSGPAPVDADNSAARPVLRHAIADLTPSRRGPAPLVGPAPGGVAPAQLAMPEDRIQASEGRTQRYGTQSGWRGAALLRPPGGRPAARILRALERRPRVGEPVEARTIL